MQIHIFLQRKNNPFHHVRNTWWCELFSVMKTLALNWFKKVENVDLQAHDLKNNKLYQSETSTSFLSQMMIARRLSVFKPMTTHKIMLIWTMVLTVFIYCFNDSHIIFSLQVHFEIKSILYGLMRNFLFIKFQEKSNLCKNYTWQYFLIW